MAYGDPEPFDPKIWIRRLKIFALWAAIPSVFLGRAALSYYGGPTICFSPLKIVSDQDHINAIVENLQHTIIYNKNDSQENKLEKTRLRSLDPKTCCKVLRRGRFETFESYNKITYYTTLTGMYARIVDTRPGIFTGGKSPGNWLINGKLIPIPPIEKSYYGFPTTVCGQASKYYE